LRSGYTRTENPIPDTTFNPGIISLSAHTLSIGTGWLCRTGGRFLGVLPCGADRSGIWPKALGLDNAFQEWFYEPRTVAGNLNPAVDGTYHTFVHLGTVSLQMRF
jgi:long-chain fatty acid transport protein